MKVSFNKDTTRKFAYLKIGDTFRKNLTNDFLYMKTANSKDPNFRSNNEYNAIMLNGGILVYITPSQDVIVVDGTWTQEL